MAAASDASGVTSARGGRRDTVVLPALWIVLSIIGCVLVAVVWGPHMPPGGMTEQASSQRTDITVLGTIATPVVIGVLLYFGWALAFWRQPAGDDTDAAPIHGNTKVAATWIASTAVIVLALAVYGTVELIVPAGAGAGQGPSPVFNRGIPATVSETSWTPGSNSTLQVQVIGQQWAWTYRYPQFGGFESTQLEIPAGETVQFNVTSLDVIHSFWAYQLGVKADANPGINNVAYAKPTQLGTFTVRCAELCGIWHGAMYNFGKVVTGSQFVSWAQSSETQLASVTKLLPPYATTYDPTVVNNMGKVNQQLGLTGAGGGYYNPADPEQP